MLKTIKNNASEFTGSQVAYITAIQKLTQENWYARAIDIARELLITAGSCSTWLKSLEKKWLIQFDKNKFIQLTEFSEKKVIEIHNKQQLLQAFFEKNWYSKDEAIQESSNLAYIVSEKFINIISK